MIVATIERLENSKWKFTWSVGTPPYSIWLDGRLIAEGLTDEEYTYSGSAYIDTPPPLEILNDGDWSYNRVLPPRVTVQWRGSLEAAAYLVQEYVDASWVTRVRVMEQASGYYRWTSETRPEAQLSTWRVLPLDIQGNEGNALTFDVMIYRNPAPPDVDVAIVNKKVRVSAAS